jgi:hypothetical protein
MYPSFHLIQTRHCGNASNLRYTLIYTYDYKRPEYGQIQFMFYSSGRRNCGDEFVFSLRTAITDIFLD